MNSEHEKLAAELEPIASGAIALPVRVVGIEAGDAMVGAPGLVTLCAPHHTTPDGIEAIRAACAVAFVGEPFRFAIVLDDPPASP